MQSVEEKLKCLLCVLLLKAAKLWVDAPEMGLDARGCECPRRPARSSVPRAAKISRGGVIATMPKVAVGRV